MGDMDDDHADHGCCQGIESRRSKARGGVQPDSQSQREDRHNDAGDVEGPIVVPGEVADVVASDSDDGSGERRDCLGGILGRSPDPHKAETERDKEGVPSSVELRWRSSMIVRPLPPPPEPRTSR
jgi:hypothetical protein